jgi:DNA repair exonuclease SbcCD ATPase subunit
MQIKRLRLQNYACHADTTLDDLGPVTVLVGPNGAGKSSLFEAIRTLSRILTGPIS